MDFVRAAVIGYGNMGSAHAQCIWDGRVRGMKLVSVCDINPARLEAAKARFPGVSLREDYHEVLADPEVDAVIIAVPHPMHGVIGIDALGAGKHTLTEKPIDVRLSQARALCAAAEKTDRVFAIMLNQRTNPLFQKAREIVQGGQLGALKRSVWIITNWYRTQHYYDSGAWRATWDGEGGGVLLNQAPHNLDLWQWICGMPVSVRGFCDVAKYHHIEVEDDATLMVRYENGATGLFITSTGEYPGTNRLEISGELGKVVLEEGRLKWWKLSEAEGEVRFASDGSSPAIPYQYEEITADRPETAHTGILQNYTDAILRGEPLLSPGADGLNELTLSNAAYLSQWTGNQEIALPMDTAAFDALLQEHIAHSEHVVRTAEEHPDGQYSHRWQVNW